MLTNHMIRRFVIVAAIFALSVGFAARGSVASHAAVFPSHSGRWAVKSIGARQGAQLCCVRRGLIAAPAPPLAY